MRSTLARNRRFDEGGKRIAIVRLVVRPRSVIAIAAPASHNQNADGQRYIVVQGIAGKECTYLLPIRHVAFSEAASAGKYFRSFRASDSDVRGGWAPVRVSSAQAECRAGFARTNALIAVRFPQ